MPKTKQPAPTANAANTAKKASYALFQSSDSYFFTALQYGKGDILGKGDITAQDLRRAFANGEFQLVHTFRRPLENIANQLEIVFRDSQNLRGHWNRASPCRSTSVGDVVRVGNEYWIVASVGFHLGWQD